jgi:NAD(P)-dependent dehydrogenase (short-subunit alcohol dehydrogenase family)
MSAIVTGSTTGIGEAIARRFGAEGAAVLIHGRDEEKGELVVDSIRAAGGLADGFYGDLADPDVCSRLVDAAASSLGGLDVLVNNAAVTERSDIETTDADQFDRVVSVNLRAPLLLIRAAMPYFRKSGGGRVLNIGSVNAYNGERNLLAYSISKGGLMTLTRNLAAAHAHEGILFTDFNVGWVLTPNEYALKIEEGFEDGWHESLPRSWVPSGRLLSVEQIAHFALAFVDPAGGPVSGSVLELEQQPVIGLNPSKDPIGQTHSDVTES